MPLALNDQGFAGWFIAPSILIPFMPPKEAAFHCLKNAPLWKSGHQTPTRAWFLPGLYSGLLAHISLCHRLALRSGSFVLITISAVCAPSLVSEQGSRGAFRVGHRGASCLSTCLNRSLFKDQKGSAARSLGSIAGFAMK